MEYFQYGEKEIKYLKEKDKILGKVIDEIGLIKRKINPKPFEALIFSIVSQQISNKAAETVWERFNNLLVNISPENIKNIDLDAIKNCGMSNRKAGYIKGIAHAAISGEVDFDSFYSLNDDEIIKKLSSLHGVGEWTAEMLLIFSFNRLDVVSYKDLAIRRGMKRLYGLNELTKKEFEKIRGNYSPYGSVASLYLWYLSK